MYKLLNNIDFYDKNEVDALIQQTDVSQERQERIEADASLQDKINAEANARETLATELTIAIDTNRTGIDLQSTKLDSYQATVEQTFGNISSEIGALHSGLAVEQQARVSADEILSAHIDTVETNLDTEVTERQTEDTKLTNSIAAINNKFSKIIDNPDPDNLGLKQQLQKEITDRETAVTNESTARAAQDTELLARIEQLETADEGLSTSISNIVIGQNTLEERYESEVPTLQTGMESAFNSIGANTTDIADIKSDVATLQDTIQNIQQGINNYNELENKPSINGTTLTGQQTMYTLNLVPNTITRQTSVSMVETTSEMPIWVGTKNSMGIMVSREQATYISSNASIAINTPITQASGACYKSQTFTHIFEYGAAIQNDIPQDPPIIIGMPTVSTVKSGYPVFVALDSVSASVRNGKHSVTVTYCLISTSNRDTNAEYIVSITNCVIKPRRIV